MNKFLKAAVAVTPFAFALLATASFAVTPSSSGKAATEAGNFDARIGLQQDAAAAPAAAQSAELAAFSRLLPDLAVGIDSATGATRTLMNRVGFLTDADGMLLPKPSRAAGSTRTSRFSASRRKISPTPSCQSVTHQLSGTTTSTCVSASRAWRSTTACCR